MASDAPPPSLVSVVIVSYNTRENLRHCLSCIEPEHEIIVVDNGSVDGSAEMVRSAFPGVKLLEAGENLGFGRANNRGARIATRDLLLFLNSDCYAELGSIAKLAGAFSDLSVSGAGGRLMNLDGTLQESTANRMTLRAVLWEQTFLERLLPIYWTTKRLYRDAEAKWEEELLAETMRREEAQATGRTRVSIPDEFAIIVPTYQVMGACLMCRRASFPGFDERFFLYMEDTMLCDALNEIGEIVWHFHAPFVHELGASSAKEWWRGIVRYNAGKELYFEITEGEGARRRCRALNRFGALLRMVLKPRRAAGFLRVFRAR